MTNNELQQLIEQNIQGATVRVEGDGSHFNVIVISDVFDGKSRIEQQQLVYQAVGEQIKTGNVHALTMKTYTVFQWQQLPDKPIDITF